MLVSAFSVFDFFLNKNSFMMHEARAIKIVLLYYFFKWANPDLFFCLFSSFQHATI